jgi:hypothetical protein
MRKLVGESILVASLTAAALGATACSNSTKVVKSPANPVEVSANCDGGLPSFMPEDSSRGTYFFQFPKGCDEKSIGVYKTDDPYSKTPAGYLKPDFPFKIICEHMSDKPTNVYVESTNPDFAGSVNLSDGAFIELSRPNDFSIPVCPPSKTPNL